MDKNQNDVHFYMGSHIERKNGKGGFIYEYYSDFLKNFFFKEDRKGPEYGKLPSLASDQPIQTCLLLDKT